MPQSKDSSAIFQAFQRYEQFTDLAALIDFSSRPLRKSLRVNTLKCSVEELRSWGKKKEWKLEPVPWCEEGLFVDRENRDEALGKDLLHLFGYFYMQEAASMLPVALLDPQPGEMVLDMSAAPGSKSTQIADRMQNTGVLIANDVQEKRLWSLLSNLQRCGVLNVIVVRKVGQWFAGHMTERFDRVLCDAPCTAQGTARKDSDALTFCSTENIGKMAKLQRELLESAVHACKVGGRIVYSTCTLTPEENEGVVLSILNKFSTQLEVVDPRTYDKDMGLRTWDLGTAIRDSENIQKVLSPTSYSPYPFLRLWPQTYDTEGFFSAVLQKNAPTKPRAKGEEPHRFDVLGKTPTNAAKARLEDWYGSSFLDDGDVLLSQREQICVLGKDAASFLLPVQPYYTGLPFAKLTDHGLPRLGHEMATLRGHRAQKQMLTLSAYELRQSMRGVNVAVTEKNFDDGDVLLGLKENALERPIVFGRGVLKKGILLNRLPREIVRMFA